MTVDRPSSLSTSDMVSLPSCFCFLMCEVQLPVLTTRSICRRRLPQALHRHSTLLPPLSFRRASLNSPRKAVLKDRRERDKRPCRDGRNGPCLLCRRSREGVEVGRGGPQSGHQERMGGLVRFLVSLLSTVHLDVLTAVQTWSLQVPDVARQRSRAYQPSHADDISLRLTF